MHKITDLNLIIDVGNTQIKVAVFRHNTLQAKEICENNTFVEMVMQLQKAFPALTHAIISSVGNFKTTNLQWVKTHFNTLVLSHQVALPFVNKYGTPKTLGVDRIALVSAAAVNFPKSNCLIIDAGSCITYDFLTKKNEYLGGAISPGIMMRYHALHTFTHNLPDLSKSKENQLIGNSTKSSIHIGVVQGVLFEMEGYISRYHKDYKDLTVILTGGDAHFLLDSLNFNIFANSNFLLEGLNYILEHNIN